MDEERSEPIPGVEPWEGSTRELASALRSLVLRLRADEAQRLPGADLATVAADLASRLAEAEEEAKKARGDHERLELALREFARAEPASRGSAARTDVPDDYYWRFEQRMRGSPEELERRLRGYEDLVVSLREALSAEDTEPPRWIDLGCGRGEFCAVLMEWGWRSEGVDASSGAVEACRERGIDVTLADVLAYLETRVADPVGGVSAIQLIEHMPRHAWVHLFEEVHRALIPGGAFLLETINGRNLDAIADHFVADVTHTWPGHPETLRLMAEHAGFGSVEVRFLHDDHRGNAQDVAIWARKAAA